MAQDFNARHNRGLKLFQLRRHRHVLQHAVDAVPNAKFIFKWFQVNIRRAQFNRVLEHLIDEANNRRFILHTVEVCILVRIFVHHLEAFFLTERADRIRADAQALFHLALNRFGRGENRLQIQARQSFQRIQPLRCEKAACGDFHRAVGALERKQFLLQQNARGK